MYRVHCTDIGQNGQYRPQSGFFGAKSRSQRIAWITSAGFLPQVSTALQLHPTCPPQKHPGLWDPLGLSIHHQTCLCVFHITSLMIRTVAAARDFSMLFIVSSCHSASMMAFAGVLLPRWPAGESKLPVVAVTLPAEGSAVTASTSRGDSSRVFHWTRSL